MKYCYLIDYSNWAYKFDSVYNIRQNIKGVEVSMSVLMGFIRALKANPFSDIFICLDGYPADSKRLIPSYKSNRSKEPRESLSFPRKDLIKILTKLGERLGKNIKVVVIPNKEADQVIASIAHLVSGKVTPLQEMLSTPQDYDLTQDCYLAKLSKPEFVECGFRDYDGVIIASTDSDMHQLKALPNVYMDTSTNGRKIDWDRNITPDAVGNVRPEAINMYKAIVGDSSDCIPSLALPKPIQSLKAIINETFTSEQDSTIFCNAIQSGVCDSLNEGMQTLFDLIIQKEATVQFSINYKVANLCYCSTPRALSYPTYCIEDAIEQNDLTI